MSPRRFAPLLFALAATPASAGEVVLPALRDNTLYSESGNLSNGAGDHVFAGVTAMGNLRRALVQFDVASAVPAGSTVVLVELDLDMSLTISGPAPIGVHRVLASWGEGTSHAFGNEGAGATATAGDATWTLRSFPGTPWAAPGGDFVALASASVPIDGNGSWIWSSSGLAADVQSWLDAPAQNHGWLLKTADEVSGPSAKRFDSRTNPVPSVRPRLRVVYSPPCNPSAQRYCIGAANTTGQGARIDWSGSTSVQANGFTLNCDRLPAGTSAVFFFGRTQAMSGFGDGFLCIAGEVVRLNPPAVATASGAVARPVDLAPLSAAGLITPGSRRNFQCIYRNLAPQGSGFNLSDGLSLTFCP